MNGELDIQEFAQPWLGRCYNQLVIGFFVIIFTHPCLICSPGSHLRLFRTNVGTFQGVELSGVGESTTYPQTVQRLVDALANRYTDVSTGILNATKICYLPSWPDKLDPCEYPHHLLLLLAMPHQEQQFNSHYQAKLPECVICFPSILRKFLWWAGINFNPSMDK